MTHTTLAPWMQRLGLRHPIIQAPMTGTATPQLAAAVSNAGALGSIGLGAYSLEKSKTDIEHTQSLTSGPFNVNLFYHQHPQADAQREQAWLEYLAPEFARFGATAPARLQAVYPSALGNTALQQLILAQRPAVVSFHFGLPEPDFLAALKAYGCITLACATDLDEALAIEQAGIDVVIAQGVEAGGHRGVFDPARDQMLGTLALVQLLVQRTRLPVVAAGGIMDGAGIAAVLQLGACAAQMGTTFVPCPESNANAAYRQALLNKEHARTAVTSAISGRPARGLVNRLHALGAAYPGSLPAYPQVYDAGKALHQAASAQGCTDFAPFWAGQGVALARALPAAQLVQVLAAELAQAQLRGG